MRFTASSAILTVLSLLARNAGARFAVRRADVVIAEATGNSSLFQRTLASASFEYIWTPSSDCCATGDPNSSGGCTDGTASISLLATTPDGGDKAEFSMNGGAGVGFDGTKKCPPNGNVCWSGTTGMSLTAPVNTINVAFGFNASEIKATKGSVLTFEFTGIPGNHTVTQSSFAAPCQPLANGFDSGWIEILANTTTLPTWKLTVTDDSKPIWFYCKQLLPQPHCSGGMVGVINVQPGENSFKAFQAKAATDTAPGQAQGGLVGVGASAAGQPDVGSGATQFLGAAAGTASGGASGSAPAASGASAAPSGSATAPATGAALALGVSFKHLAFLFGVFAGGAMVL
ncbi:hypothetical protein C8R43DRAFT_1128188 [Mycena crocata]|nr:hypothetical protein C8R43DRAFT_1128188 [Mycena crocata]